MNMQTKKQLREKIASLESEVEILVQRKEKIEDQRKGWRERCLKTEDLAERHSVGTTVKFMRYLGVLESYNRQYPSLMYGDDPQFHGAAHAFIEDLDTAIAAMDADDAQDRLSGNFKTTEKGE